MPARRWNQRQTPSRQQSNPEAQAEPAEAESWQSWPEAELVAPELIREGPQAEPEPEAEAEEPPRRGGPATDPLVRELRLSWWRTLAEPVLYTVEQTIIREIISTKAEAARKKFGD